MSSEPATRITCRALPEAVQHDSNGHLAGLCTTLHILSQPPIGTHLELIITDLRPDHVTAHLEWRTGADPQTGPSVDFGFLDTRLGPDQYTFVINGLLAATNLY